MPPLRGHDAIRILVATDNHVGYQETHAVRGDDSWKTFHEVMTIAKEQDVDMVLLGGDLFDKHTPSRKSMVNVIRSLRMNCLGDKPCELEFLSDGSEIFGGTFNHVNYEDQDINVAIPVFSIHGNHDEPTGHEFYCALDVLQETGLVNYFGRVPKNDNIEVKPVLLQKGRTKIAMFGLSNVRDERLFREFRNGNVKFFQPSQQKSDWFNLMVVHQNHHARTTTGYLPENFLPDFMDLVIWGHEHDCVREPQRNPDQNFFVIQPGSSIATQLMPGEAIDKHIGILTIKGKEFVWDPIRLKSVRPFVMREIVLSKIPEMKALVRKTNNRPTISRYLHKIIHEMIEEANQKWLDLQGDELEDADEDEKTPPLPLLRLKVDYTASDGGNFDCENAQRITNQFIGKVANHEDIILYHIKKASTRRTDDEIVMPDKEVIEQMTLDSAKVEELVREFLTAQTLTILPQNQFGDSVNQFVDKDDKDAMRQFVSDSLLTQIENLLKMEDVERVEITDEVDKNRQRMEEEFTAGNRRVKTKRVRQPRPATWDSDLEGPWEDQIASTVFERDDDDSMDIGDGPSSKDPAKRGAGRGRGKTTASTSTRKPTTTSKKAASSTTRGGRAKKAQAFVDEDEDEDEESDINMLLEQDHEDESEKLFVQPAATTRRGAASETSKTAVPKRGTAAARSKPSSAAKQTTLDFTQQSQRQRAPSSRTAAQKKKVIEISDDDISDDDDAFEPVAPAKGSRRR